MNATHDQTAKAQARKALDQAAGAGLGSDRDRRIHGLAVAGFGSAVGAYVALNPLAQQHGWLRLVLLAAYVVTLGGLAVWQGKASRTVPRHSRRIGYAGLAGTTVLTLAGIMWMNVRQSDNRIAGQPDQLDAWWVYVTVGLVVALPMLLAGAVIRREPK